MPGAQGPDRKPIHPLSGCVQGPSPRRGPRHPSTCPSTYGRVKFPTAGVLNPQGLGHTLFSMQTPPPHAPLHGRLQVPVHLASGPSSAVHGEESRITAPFHRRGRHAPRGDRRPVPSASLVSAPQGSLHGALHLPATGGKCSLLPRIRAACSLELPGHGTCPQGPLLRLCNRYTPRGWGHGDWSLSAPSPPRPRGQRCPGPTPLPLKQQTSR